MAYLLDIAQFVWIKEEDYDKAKHMKFSMQAGSDAASENGKLELLNVI